MEGRNPKKKVGYILRKFPVLSETFVLNEILELEAQGVEVHIFSVERPNCPRFHKNLHKLKAHVTYLPDLLKLKSLLRHRKKAKKHFGRGYRKAFRYLCRHLNPSLALRLLQSCYVCNAARKENIAHFHAHFATRATTIAFFSSLISDIPYSFTAHAVDIFKDSLCRRALSRKIDHADFVVTVSDFNVEFLSAHFQYSSHKIMKVHNGIDLSLFQPANGSAAMRPFTFLCVARFVEKKGHRILVEACDILRKQGVDFRCLCAGKGKLEPQIRKMIKQKKLGDVIEILGALTHEEVLEAYHLSDAFVLPCVEGKDCNKDGLPVSLVESLACGLPVVTTPMTGNPEVVKDGVNGFLVPFEDPEMTADAMKRMIEDQHLYETLRSNARNSVAQTFDCRTTVKSLAARFQGV